MAPNESELEADLQNLFFFASAVFKQNCVFLRNGRVANHNWLVFL